MDFTQTSSCAGPVEPGRHCLIRVRFDPARRGASEAYLLIRHNSSRSPQRISLTGNGITRTRRH
jgi:hypothetical protein